MYSILLLSFIGVATSCGYTSSQEDETRPTQSASKVKPILHPGSKPEEDALDRFLRSSNTNQTLLILRSSDTNQTLPSDNKPSKNRKGLGHTRESSADFVIVADGEKRIPTPRDTTGKPFTIRPFLQPYKSSSRVSQTPNPPVNSHSESSGSSSLPLYLHKPPPPKEKER